MSICFLLSLSTATMLLGACDFRGPMECHHGIWLEIDPNPAHMTVGDRLVPDARIERCPDPAEVSVRLESTDPSIVSVEKDSVLLATGPGATTVRGLHEQSGMRAEITVVVVD